MPSKILAIAFMVLTFSFALGDEVQLPNPDELMTRIDKEGGRKVLQELWKDEDKFYSTLEPVEHGDPKWVKLWLDLRRFSDAGITESIDIAFALALPENPEFMLGLVGSAIPFETLCTSPFIEPEPGVAEEYEKRTLEALAKLKNSKLKDLAEKCAKKVKLHENT